MYLTRRFAKLMKNTSTETGRKGTAAKQQIGPFFHQDRCQCCDKPLPIEAFDAYWNAKAFEGEIPAWAVNNPTRVLCDGCHWDPHNKFSECNHNGTREAYFASWEKKQEGAN